MPTALAAILAAAAGACIALQASANGKFRENLQSPAWAAYFSICGTILTGVPDTRLRFPKALRPLVGVARRGQGPLRTRPGTPHARTVA